MPLASAVHRVAGFTDNYFWLFAYQPARCAVIDPGDAAPVLAEAERLGLAITHVLNTHWHPDHVGGNLAIKEATGCTIIGPAREAARIPGIVRAVDEGDAVPLGGHVADVLFVGAHTAGHIAYHFAAAGLLFPGDTLFAMGCGRLFEGSAEDMHRALGKLAALPPETLVYCAHEYTLGNARFAVTIEPDNRMLADRYARVQAERAKLQPTVPFTIADELATNPFVRARDAAELAERRRAKDAF